MGKRLMASLMATAFGASLFTLGAPAVEAGSKGRKNTAIILGGLAAHQLLKGKTKTGIVAGAGAAYAYKRYRDKRKRERRFGR